MAYIKYVIVKQEQGEKARLCGLCNDQYTRVQLTYKRQYSRFSLIRTRWDHKN